MSATAPPRSVIIATNAPGLTPERPVEWPRRAVRTLPNGLQVVLAESHTFPKIAAQLYFRSGNALVAHRAPGLASMTATVARTGTTNRNSQRIEQDLRRMGADLATSAGADSSSIAIAGLSEFSAGLLGLIGDLAQNASFPDEEFERERRQRLEETRIERTTPGFLANERIRRVIFGQHPYGIIAPTEQQVAAYERDELVEFYRRHYSPSDALLIVVGDFNTDELFGQIEKTFGDWSSLKPAAAEFLAPPRYQGRHVHLVHLPGSVQTQVTVGVLGITRRAPDWHATVLANAIYGGAFHSRLVMNIREQKGYTYSPRSGMNALRQQGYFTVSAAVRPDVAAATLAEIFYEMDRMRALPVTPEELDSARNYLTGVFSLGVATLDGLIGQLSTVHLERLPEGYLENYRQRVRALTADDVIQAARQHFDSANGQIVLVGDRQQIGEQAALFGDVTTYDAYGEVLQA